MSVLPSAVFIKIHLSSFNTGIQQLQHKISTLAHSSEKVTLQTSYERGSGVTIRRFWLSTKRWSVVATYLVGKVLLFYHPSLQGVPQTLLQAFLMTEELVIQPTSRIIIYHIKNIWNIKIHKLLKILKTLNEISQKQKKQNCTFLLSHPAPLRNLDFFYPKFQY